MEVAGKKTGRGRLGMGKGNQVADPWKERISARPSQIGPAGNLRTRSLIVALVLVGFSAGGNGAEAGSLGGLLRSLGYQRHHRHSHAIKYSGTENPIPPPQADSSNVANDTVATIRPVAPPSTVPTQSNTASTAAVGRSAENNFPHAVPIPNKQGFVASPFAANKVVDVRGFPGGTEVKDPYTGKVFITP
ncbi:MAG TPA: hypothetical protein VGH08_12095 [Chthoniobacterales bacterium]|jgi:hypothetical protein